MKTLFTILTSSFIIILSAQIASAQDTQKRKDAELNFIARVTQHLILGNNPALKRISPSKQLETGYLYCQARDRGITKKTLNDNIVKETMDFDDTTASYLFQYFVIIHGIAEDTLCPQYKEARSPYSSPPCIYTVIYPTIHPEFHTTSTPSAITKFKQG